MFISLLSLMGCSISLKSKEATVDKGIEISTSVKSEKKGQPGNLVFDCTTNIKNVSDEELTHVYYSIKFYDKDNNEVIVVNPSWYGLNVSLKPGESIKHEFGFQDKDMNAKSVKVEVLEVDTIKDRPLVHLPEEGKYLYQELNDEHINNLDKELPVKIEGYIDHGGAREVATITDKELIKETVDAFKNITIAKETNEYVTDNYNGVIFTFEDGSEYGISLNLHNLELNISNKIHLYEFNNCGPFWKIIEDNAKPE